MNTTTIGEIMNVISLISKQPRYPGTEGSAFSKQLIKEELVKSGYEIYTHSTNIKNWSMKDTPWIEVMTSKNEIIQAIPAMLSEPTPTEGIIGSVASVEPINILDSFPWHRLAILDKYSNPVAFIISTDRDIRVQPIPQSEQKYPYVIIDYQGFSAIHDKISADPRLLVRLNNPAIINGESDIESIFTHIQSSNNYILVCAHYDSTFNSNGALDNASGVAVALQIAKLAKKNSWPCRFAFFDGEELNKAGSTAYVCSLKKEEIDRISYVIEIDTVGSGHEIVLLCSKKISKHIRSIPFMHDALDSFDININPQSRISFCDVWPFMQQGIPVVRMLTRAPKGSGQGHDLIHTNQDTYDKVACAGANRPLIPEHADQ